MLKLLRKLLYKKVVVHNLNEAAVTALDLYIKTDDFSLADHSYYKLGYKVVRAYLNSNKAVKEFAKHGNRMEVFRQAASNLDVVELSIEFNQLCLPHELYNHEDAELLIWNYALRCGCVMKSIKRNYKSYLKL